MHCVNYDFEKLKFHFEELIIAKMEVFCKTMRKILKKLVKLYF